MEISHTRLPESEVEIFKNLPDIKVVFDVGARDDTDYLDLKPDLELHAFEPNPVFFAQLKEKVSARNLPHSVFLNDYGLGIYRVRCSTMRPGKDS